MYTVVAGWSLEQFQEGLKALIPEPCVSGRTESKPRESRINNTRASDKVGEHLPTKV